MSGPRSRLRSYAAIVAQVLSPTLVVAFVLSLGGRLFPAEGVAQMDFQCFWAASELALAGEPARVYDAEALHAAQRALRGLPDAPAGSFYYPPLALLLFLPLALLPYPVSAVAWLASTALAYALALRALLPGWMAVMPFLAFPAALLNAWYVQNGFLSAALLGAAAALLRTRPVLAGICIGCLAYKPQLGLLLPLTLAAGGRWRAFAAAAGTVLGLAAAATLAFGAEIWPAFEAGMENTRRWLEATPRRVSFDMASVYAAAKMLNGGRLGWAIAAQALAAVGACALAVAAIRRAPGAAAEVALAAAAGALATPYLFHYDQAILAVPLAWLAAEAHRTGFLPWERAALVALLVSPALAYAAVLAWEAPLAPLVSLGVLAAVLRRVRHFTGAGVRTPAPPSREALA